MSFESLEESINSGSPTELYVFEYGAKKYLYTTNEVAITYLSEVYEPLSMHRTKISQNTERGKNDITVVVPRLCEVASLFVVAPPTEKMSLSILRIHRGDLTDAVVIWKGRVINSKYTSEQTAELLCESFYTSLGRMGLRRGFGRQCDHALYDAQCRLVKSNYAFTSAPTLVTNLQITVTGADGYADGYFEGGTIEWLNSDSNVQERRMVASHVGELITVTHHILQLVSGQEVLLYPGCPHDMATCKSRFGNLDNYGGFPFMPEMNPFGGSALF